MRFEQQIVPQVDRLSAAFEHSITWEDDLWRADPVDVEAIHAPARRKFAELLDAVTAERGSAAQARILLFHGQSGAGKTHLIRALRTSAHRAGKAYVGYAQMTPDVANYADYYLRRLVNSLEKPYDPDQGGESGLARLTNHLVGDKGVLDPAALEKLREAKLNEAQLAKMVLALADEIVNAPKLAGQSLDINIVRALLYLQRSDPRIDQRVRQYLYGRQLTDLSVEAVAALDPNTGEGRAFEIIESLGRLMWTVDRAALVFCIDQVEDLRFFSDPQERFQKAARDLIQVANRVPTSIVLVSCLGDFYGNGAGGAGAVLRRPHREGGTGAPGRGPHGARGAPHHRQAPGARRRQRPPRRSQPLFRSGFLRGVRGPLDAAHPGARPGARARAGGRRRAGRRAAGEAIRLHIHAGRGAGFRRRRRRRRRRGRPGNRLPRAVGALHGPVGGGDPARRSGPARRADRRADVGARGVGPRHRARHQAPRGRRGPARRRPDHAARQGLHRRGPHLPVQPADPGRRLQAPARPGPPGHDGQELLHAAGERLPAQQEEPDRAGLPQVPRERRALAAGAHHRLGAHDDGARVPCPASPRPGLCRLVPGREAAVGHPGAGADAAARPVRGRRARRQAGRKHPRAPRHPRRSRNRKRKSCRCPSCSTRRAMPPPASWPAARCAPARASRSTRAS